MPSIGDEMKVMMPSRKDTRWVTGRPVREVGRFLLWQLDRRSRSLRIVESVFEMLRNCR